MKSKEEFANSDSFGASSELHSIYLNPHRQHIHLSSKHPLSTYSGPAGGGDFSQHPHPHQSSESWSPAHHCAEMTVANGRLRV